MLVDQMCNAVKPIMEAIHQHPFNRELAQGILPEDKFIYYLEQDSLYLAEYFRVLALIGSRLSHHEHAKQYLHFALDALSAENALHANYLQQYKSRRAKHSAMNPTCFMYTHYLLSSASFSSIEEAVASSLPCFWVYREVSKRMLATAQLETNPYQAWITLYSGEEMDRSVTAAINIMNHLSENHSAAMQQKMIAAFIKATQLEWMFWDAAYRQEKWQIGCDYDINLSFTKESIHV